ncbi:sigma-70 family RNA polymerase sigma factor [Winogradskya consettensis]|uniref:RNA polymerase sigma factor n=1 Tax=Winogradskya consettensis TaxID=113560 RepID=A0A919VSB4_9ACTN|nr:RNA polymerase subunit sigma-70 [Actinoplanes consettensis]GIM74651.1 RNA polymerase sigma factor [Actinoplanes consettensis]
MRDRPEFSGVAEPLRRELFVHCYRMLGSAQDAEDQVQETFLRAWRAYDRFEGRSSVRVWLYRIATNACLRALQQSGRRALPSDLSAAAEDPWHPVGAGDRRAGWLQPLPTDPADVVAGRDQVRLAMVAALHYLPARQRAALLLRDVVGMTAAEVAGVLETTTAAVNSASQRARAQLAALRAAPGDVEGGHVDQALLDRYVDAFRNADLAALEKILLEDVTLEMPPYETWFRGRDTVLAFLGARILDRPGRVDMVPVVANGQRAFAVYVDREAHAVHLAGVDHLYFFLDPGLFALFGAAPMISGAGVDRYR